MIYIGALFADFHVLLTLKLLIKITMTVYQSQDGMMAIFGSGTADDHDLIDVRLNRVLGLKRDFKRYTSTISDKPLHQKKRAMLLELKTKIETLLKDYL